MDFKKKDFIGGTFYLYEKFKDNDSFAVGKIGNCELMCIYNYFLFST